MPVFRNPRLTESNDGPSNLEGGEEEWCTTKLIVSVDPEKAICQIIFTSLLLSVRSSAVSAQRHKPHYLEMGFQ